MTGGAHESRPRTGVGSPRRLHGAQIGPLRILDLSAQLKRKTVWIVNVETVFGRSRILSAALNLGLHSFPDTLIVVPVCEREADVIDDRRGGGFSSMKD